MEPKIYDVAIIGGGLAGLTLSIQLARTGVTVILMEKEEYPFHKVCGEYISMEAWNYLTGLGLPLMDMHLPGIRHLIVTSPSGRQVNSSLDLGGFGISRFKIDNDLKNIAIKEGVTVVENCKADSPAFSEELFTIKTNIGVFQSKVCCGNFGKRSNIDVKWRRTFVSEKKSKLNNYVGIKYHIKSTMPADTIALHNFEGGYCGISAIENDNYCLCYLTNAESLRMTGSIQQLEENVLAKNPHLKKVFNESSKLMGPVTISQISFEKKSQVEDHVILVGDAAGMITPLCGNGMSMAMQAGKIASVHIANFLSYKITRQEMENMYQNDWNKQFSARLTAGRMIQKFFGKVWLTNAFIAVMQKLPWLTRKTISLTHGKPF